MDRNVHSGPRRNLYSKTALHEILITSTLKNLLELQSNFPVRRNSWDCWCGHRSSFLKMWLGPTQSAPILYWQFSALITIFMVFVMLPLDVCFLCLIWWHTEGWGSRWHLFSDYRTSRYPIVPQQIISCLYTWFCPPITPALTLNKAGFGIDIGRAECLGYQWKS